MKVNKFSKEKTTILWKS